MRVEFFDDKLHSQLFPLTLTRPSSDLRIGILTIAEKWEKILSADKIGFKTLDYLNEFYPKLESKADISINGRLLPSPKIVEQIKSLSGGQRLIFEGTVLAQCGDDPDFNIEVEEASLICWPWDLFLKNVSQINFDRELLMLQNIVQTNIEWKGVIISAPLNIYADQSAIVEPGAMLLADDGPIFLGKNATVMAGSIIRGNNAICDDATIKMGAKFYEGSTIGPHCKVGGEVQNSIFHSYSNKGHDGYIGNSVIGQWCNLGAGTDTSNLKNNYSKISINRWGSSEKIDTNQQFIGTIMGDHSKIAIGTRLNTATQCGVFANVFSSGFPPKIIPNFSWMGDKGTEVFQLDKALEMAKNMMDRRSVPIALSYEQIIRHLFDESTT